MLDAIIGKHLAFNQSRHHVAVSLSRCKFHVCKCRFSESCYSARRFLYRARGVRVPEWGVHALSVIINIKLVLSASGRSQ